jgi:hypothetical protein
MQVGVTRAFFVTDSVAEKEAAMEHRLQNRMRQLKLATRPDGTVHGGPDRATGDPRAVNEISAMYGTPDEIVDKLEELRGPVSAMCSSTAAARVAMPVGGKACAGLPARSCPASRSCYYSGARFDGFTAYTVR